MQKKALCQKIPMKTEQISGYLLLNKPSGITSNDALKIIKKKCGIKKMGHGGTLDPFATGLLFVVIGESTKFLPYIQIEPKGYTAILKLGIETDTLDSDGLVISQAPLVSFDDKKLNDICQGLLGKRSQLAPVYSAKKIDGERSYDLARRGLDVVRKNCQIEVYELRAEKIDDSTISFKTLCSSGTYVRVLGEEIAKELGCVGHLTSLDRYRLGDFHSQQSIDVDDIQTKAITPIQEAIAGSRIDLDDTQFKFINVGRPIKIINQNPGRYLVFYKNNFLGLCVLDGDLLKPERLNVL